MIQCVRYAASVLELNGVDQASLRSVTLSRLHSIVQEQEPATEIHVNATQNMHEHVGGIYFLESLFY